MNPELEEFVEAVAACVVDRIAPRRCLVCNELLPLEADPVVTCGTCGTELVVLTAYDQIHVFLRDELPTAADAFRELEALR